MEMEIQFFLVVFVVDRNQWQLPSYLDRSQFEPGKVRGIHFERGELVSAQMGSVMQCLKCFGLGVMWLMLVVFL